MRFPLLATAFLLTTSAAWAQRHLAIEEGRAFLVDPGSGEREGIERPIKFEQTAEVERAFLTYEAEMLEPLAEASLAEALRVSWSLAVRQRDGRAQRELLETIRGYELRSPAVMALLARIFQEGADDGVVREAADLIRAWLLFDWKNAGPKGESWGEGLTFTRGFTPDFMMGDAGGTPNLARLLPLTKHLLHVAWAFGRITDKTRDEALSGTRNPSFNELRRLIEFATDKRYRTVPFTPRYRSDLFPAPLLVEVAAVYLQGMIHSPPVGDLFRTDFFQLKNERINEEYAKVVLDEMGYLATKNVIPSLAAGLRQQSPVVRHGAIVGLLREPSAWIGEALLTEVGGLLANKTADKYTFQMAWLSILHPPMRDSGDAAIRNRTVFRALFENSRLDESAKAYLFGDFLRYCEEKGELHPVYPQFALRFLAELEGTEGGAKIESWLGLVPASVERLARLVLIPGVESPATLRKVAAYIVRVGSSEAVLAKLKGAGLTAPPEAPTFDDVREVFRAKVEEGIPPEAIVRGKETGKWDSLRDWIGKVSKRFRR